MPTWLVETPMTPGMSTEEPITPGRRSAVPKTAAGPVKGARTSGPLAARQKCSVRQVNMTITLAFLAPDLVRAAVEGRLPRGIGVERLRDAPAEWSRQFEALGLNPR